MFAKLAAANVRKSARDFAIYFFTLALGIAVFYAFNSIADSSAVDAINQDSRQMIELLGTLISGVSVFIAFILAFLVVYANRFLIRRRNKEFALYLTLGMQKSDLFKVSAAETLIVGVCSLAVGLAAGLALAQLLALLTASLFGGAVEGVALSVSGAAMVKTLFVFGVIFLLTIVLNTGYLFKAKLIDLLQADRKNEQMKLRNLPLSFALFIASCVIIGISYKLLIENGLLNFNEQFAAATVLVCVGTVLFFYSLSGFLLRAVQFIKPLYYRGLNMFFLRQLAARVNSAFASMSVIALTLFLAMTSVCGGIGICNALSSNIEAGTRYDASVTSTYAMWNSKTGALEPLVLGGFEEFAQARGYDMARGLADSTAAVGASSWDLMVEKSAQLNFYVSDVTMGALEEKTGENIEDYAGAGVLNGASLRLQPLDIVRASEFNAARELGGLEPVRLGEGECVLWNDFSIAEEYCDAVAEEAPVLDVFGHELAMQTAAYHDTVETIGIPWRAVVLVVPDECVPADSKAYTTLLDVQCKPGQAAAFQKFVEDVEESSNPQTQPVHVWDTRDHVKSQSMGLTAVVSYLAIYIGFVLVIASAAILAIQQLTDASDNKRRYELLAKLGAPSSMISGALFKQVAVYFAFPLVLGVAHTICAMQVVIDVVKVFGSLDIGAVSLTAVVVFLAVYGMYFVLTYAGARAMVRFKRV